MAFILQYIAWHEMRPLENLGHLKQDSLPAWLSEVKKTNQSLATERASNALMNAATLREKNVAGQELIAAILSAIAQDMALIN
ncbi:hypothetical protein [Pseudoduganella sp. HUAS MS19]